MIPYFDKKTFKLFTLFQSIEYFCKCEVKVKKPLNIISQYSWASRAKNQLPDKRSYKSESKRNREVLHAENFCRIYFLGAVTWWRCSEWSKFYYQKKNVHPF